MAFIFNRAAHTDSTAISSEIGTPRHVNRKMRLCLIIALSLVILILLLFSVRFFYRPNAEIVTANIFGGTGIRIAQETGSVDSPLVSSADNGITLEVVEAVAGYDRVVLQIRYSGYENPESYVRNVIGYEAAVQPQDFSLILENGVMVHSVAPQDYCVVDNYQMTNENGTYSEYYEIPVAIGKKQNVQLDIKRIFGISGNWQVEFQLNYQSPTVLNVNETFDIFEGTLTVKNIVIDAFSTTIEYTANDNHDYWDNYLTQFQSDKEVSALQEIRNSHRDEQIVIKSDGEVMTLSDGSKGYTFITVPIPTDSRLTMESKRIDNNKSAFGGTIDLKDYD